MADSGSSSGVVALLSDLIFETKLRSSAKSLGVNLVVVRMISELEQAFQIIRPSLVIIDLNNTAGADRAIRAALAQRSRPHIVAYVSHVDEKLAEDARTAGAHQVMPRSRFNQQLPQILQAHAGGGVVPDPAI